MSYLSGKCDLYDHIYMIGSDEKYTKKQCFDRFLRETGGVIYQNIPIKVTKYNIDMVIDNNRFLNRCEGGGYEYLGKKYKTLKSLNNANISYKRRIVFHEMEDLTPYLACIICVGAFSDGKQYVELSSEPYPLQLYREMLEYGSAHESILKSYYKMLKQEYLDV